MNTPAHIAASIFTWQGEPGWRGATAVVLGAALPDLPMFGFYAWQKAIGRTEQEIWSTIYFDPSWQLFFDLFNSIPLALAVIAVCLWLRQPLIVIVAASAILHMLCDLPLHNDDAHRHFLPLGFRFQSPISYWDPKHFGMIVAPLELLFAVVASAWVSFQAPHKPMRVVARINLGLYLLVLAIALLVWVRFAFQV